MYHQVLTSPESPRFAGFFIGFSCRYVHQVLLNPTSKGGGGARLSHVLGDQASLDLRQAEHFQSGLPDMNVLMKGQKLVRSAHGLIAEAITTGRAHCNDHRGAIRRRCVGQSSMIDTRKKILTRGIHGECYTSTKTAKSSTNDTADQGCFAYNLSPYCRAVPLNLYKVESSCCNPQC